MKELERKRMISIRGKLSREEIADLSVKVLKNLRKIKEDVNGLNYLVYIDIKGEVSTEPVIRDILDRGKNVYVPISVVKTTEILVSKLDNLEDLEVSTYGIREPKKDKVSLVHPSILDVIIVPGVAFDIKGYRIGYGKGYYDRFLSSLSHTYTTIGLAYDFQVIDEISMDERDVPFDYVVTDKRIINISGEK